MAPARDCRYRDLISEKFKIWSLASFTMMKSSIFQQSLRKHSTKYAVTCPGQGLIATGLLKPYTPFRKHFQTALEEADELLQEKFSEKLFNPSPEFAKEWLIRTSNAQPAILCTTYVINKILEDEFNVDLVGNANYILGHSLGEYTALLLAGVIDFKTALSLVRKRGQLMEELVQSDEYGMIALMFKPANFETILEKAGPHLANINSFQQIVLSGKIKDIKNIITSINSERKLILRSIKLPVKIPFHSSLLEPVESELRTLMASTKVSFPSTTVVGNVSGEPIDDFIHSTIAANSKPVQWVKSMEYLIENGITDVINLGPGEVLQGINSQFKVQNTSIESIDSMEKFKNSFA